MKILIRSLLLTTLALLFLPSDAQNIDPAIVQENGECFNCHGHEKYYYYNDWVEKDIKERMNPYYIIDSVKFYQSNHKTFRCIDCHSMDYTEFPHDRQLRMEPLYECMDCHGWDDTWAQYNFEKIDEEYQKSVHNTKHTEEFSCWMCHDPHTYKLNARSNLSITEVISYDNEICLSCHADRDKYQLISSKTNPNILDTHDWLPNQEAHFRHVRCIECHTKVQDTILVAHNILPKEKAVRNCVECHSDNSLLMASLYRYEVAERRNKLGFLNGAILSEAYVIGANSNPLLKKLSIAIFVLVLLAIGVHAFLRFRK